MPMQDKILLTSPSSQEGLKIAEDAAIANQHQQIDWQDEWANSFTHGLGLLLSLIGAFILLWPSFQQNDFWKFSVLSIYAASLIFLYAASTFYHAARSLKLKKMMRIIDHCAIYLLIAGSYTPFTMFALPNTWGNMLFGMVWSIACLGIIFKVFFIHRFTIFSTCLYLVMGWLILIAAEPLNANLHPDGMKGLLAGGFFYTFGVVFFLLDKKRFYHAIWHLFVLGGSICHYCTILLYL